MDVFNKVFHRMSITLRLPPNLIISKIICPWQYLSSSIGTRKADHNHPVWKLFYLDDKDIERISNFGISSKHMKTFHLPFQISPAQSHSIFSNPKFPLGDGYLVGNAVNFVFH